ncbi:MAG: helicase associated domain-containing protein [Magnetococcales bacterium]|nr:helicase associated domain-containing protein [Magnetococcales bacterium]
MLPEHPHRERFLPLFDHVRCFGDLEQRITLLPSVTDQQAAFEIFFMAFCAVQRVRLVKDVWPLTLAPTSIRQRLPEAFAADLPIQCVWELPGGSLGVGWLSFRPHREALGRKEAQVFLAATQLWPQRACWTNSDTLPSMLERQHDLWMLRGSDFDRLDERDLKQMRRWLSGAGLLTDRLVLSRQQQSLCHQVMAPLKKDGRVTVVPAVGMDFHACLLHLLELMGSQQSILCLLPSHGHIQQLLWYWNRHASWSALSVMVCQLDGTPRHSCEMPVIRELSLAGERLTRFLQGKFHGHRVVMTTMRSLTELMTGLQELMPDFVFDWSVACQAEQLLGGREHNAAAELFLSSSQLSKRLIESGILRHHDWSGYMRSQRNEPKVVFDCSDQERYGPIVRLTADRLRSIRVVLVLMTPDRLSHPDVGLRQVGWQVMGHAMRRYQVQRLVVLSDQEPTAGPDDVASRTQMVVDTRDRASVRQTVFERFSQTSGPVLLWIHGRVGQAIDFLLTPVEADMVVVLQQNPDQHDLMAATQLLARPSVQPAHADSGAGAAWLLIPVLVQKQAGIATRDGLEQADFTPFWQALAVLVEQDESLRNIILSQRVDMGRTGQSDKRLLLERIRLLAQPEWAGILPEWMTDQCIARFSTAWEHHFGLLQRFHQQHGHCHVSLMQDEQATILADWLQEQRQKALRGRLPDDQKQQLSSMGVAMDSRMAEWEAMLWRLTAFYHQHQHVVVPKNWPDDSLLPFWIETQRRLRKRGQLSEQQIARLDQLGFLWDTQDVYWEEMFGTLAEFRALQGHCNVPDSWSGHPDLAWWVTAQRKAKASGALDPERARRLGQLGMIWDGDEAFWLQMVADFRQFYGRFNHGMVPKGWHENPKLAQWLAAQRAAVNKGLLSQERLATLQSCGFVSEPKQVLLEEMFYALEQFRSRFGHCDVPLHWPDNPELGLWVASQRQRRIRNELEPERVGRLDAMGFKWV